MFLLMAQEILLRTMDGRVAPEIESFADFVTLAYHEARNVRHLVKEGRLDKAPYRLLIDILPKDKTEAWKKMQPLRHQAFAAASAHEAEEVFRKAFGLSLEDLILLSESSHWSGTRRGGNKWAEIDRAVVKLRDAIDHRDGKRTTELLCQLPTMSHNTGLLGEKLRKLDEGVSA